MDIVQERSLINIAAEIVAAFVGNNALRPSELGNLIASVHASIMQIGQPMIEKPPVPALTAAVSIKKSVTEDYLICLDDGLKFKSLKRHLAQLGMTPDEYRKKWGLPRDYPMVAPGYAAKRSDLAKASGLGNRRLKAQQVAEPPAAAVLTNDTLVDVVTKRRGRPKKAT